MKAHTDARGALLAPLRQRLPFLPLLVAATAGILICGQLPLTSALWLGVAGIACLGWWTSKRSIFFWSLLVAVFAVAHLWQSRESAAALFAKTVMEAEVAEATGTVASEPRIFSEDRSSFDLRLKSLKTGQSLATVHFTVLADWKGPPPAYGDEVKITGILEPLEPRRNPGQFDLAAWSQRRGIFLRLAMEEKSGGFLLRRGAENPLTAFALRCQNWMRETLTTGVNDPTISDLLVAMTLGETSALPQQIQEQFRGTGTFHLFSVSGLHVGLLAVILWYALKTVGLSRRTAAAIIIPTIFFYALMTGWKPASVRSAIMTAIVLTGYFANRPPVLLNNFCAAAFLILLGDTNQLFNAGFQLSFTVVAAILLLAEPLALVLKRPFQPDPFLPDKLFNLWQRFSSHWGGKFAAACAVSLAAWLGSLPLTVGYFHLISFTALPANLAAILISFGIMAVAMLSLFFGIFSAGLAVIFNQTNWLLAKALLAVVGFFASLPGSFCYVKLPEYPRPLATIVVFDFDSGGCCYVEASGRAWLIDTGPKRMHDHTLLPFLRAQGVQRLDGLVLTHGDAGHLGAAELLLDTTQPRVIIDGPLADRSSTRRRFQQELALRQSGKSIYRAGDSLSLAPGTTLRFLYPPTGLARSVADDKALVLQLVVDHTRILMLSDAGVFTENWLMENAAPLLPCDIIIRGSPENDLANNPEFLQMAQPTVLISGKNSEEDSLPGIHLFEQDQTGAVIIKIFPNRYEVSGFANKEYFPQSQ